MNRYSFFFEQITKIKEHEVFELKKTLNEKIDNKKIREQYIKQHEAATNMAADYVQILLENKQFKSFEFYSANVSKLMPSSDENEYFKWWFELFKWKYSEQLQLRNPFMLENLRVFSKENPGVNPNRSAIYTTFHYGSSQSIIGYLISNNVNLVLLVDQKAFNSKSIFEQYIEKTKQILRINIEYDILNVEDHKTILKLISYIKKGYSVFAYPDGNNGIGGVYNKHKQLLRIKFFSDEILVRKGIAHIAFATKTPIVPIICSYKNNLLPNIFIYDAISPESKNNRDEYALLTIKELWNILEKHINNYPAQWNGWEYVHKYFDFENIKMDVDSINKKKNLKVNRKIKLNSKNFRVFKIDEQSYLFNRILYKTYEIDRELFDVLLTGKGYTKEQILKKGIKIQLLNELVKNGVFNFI